MAKSDKKQPIMREITELEIERIRRLDYNPNVMSEFDFSQLKKKIKKEGFDEPIKVVVDPENPEGYVVVSGNHRLQAMEELGFTTIPAIVERDWTEDQINAYLVSRNLNRGEIDPRKLRKLIEEKFNHFSIEEASEILGFENASELKQMAKIKDPPEFKEDEDDNIENQLNESKAEMEIIDGLQSMLASIFSEYGTDVEANFIAFMLNRKIEVMVRLSEGSGSKLDTLVKYVRDNNLDMGQVVEDMIDKYLEGE